MFYSFPIEDQMRFMFENKNFAQLIDTFKNQRTEEDGFIIHILDDLLYKKYSNGKSGTIWYFLNVECWWSGSFWNLKSFDVSGLICSYKYKYVGPYEIKKVLDKDRYVVVDIPGAPHSQKPYEGVHQSEKLKLWTSAISSSSEAEDSDVADSSEVRCVRDVG